MQYSTLHGSVVEAAQRMGGGRARPALELVGCEPDVEAAIKYAFGSSFVCQVRTEGVWLGAPPTRSNHPPPHEGPSLPPCPPNPTSSGSTLPSPTLSNLTPTSGRTPAPPRSWPSAVRSAHAASRWTVTTSTPGAGAGPGYKRSASTIGACLLSRGMVGWHGGVAWWGGIVGAPYALPSCLPGSSHDAPQLNPTQPLRPAATC